jgi:small subunit ribosomal protein S15Ae
VTNADAAPHLAGYIGDFDIIDDHRSGKIVVQLNGRLNKTGVISPRFNVQVTQIESWVNLLLPARSFGKLILVSEHSMLISLGLLMACV